MRKGILGRKIGMTQVFAKNGKIWKMIKENMLYLNYEKAGHSLWFAFGC